MAETVVRPSSPLLVALAWVVVLVPLAWGFAYTLQNALKLFVR